MKFAAGVLFAMVAMFCTIFFWPHGNATPRLDQAALTAQDAPPSTKSSADTFTCTVASITDGDTFRCAQMDAGGKQIRIRLSGVAARESDGSCTEGHPCPTASGEAATQELSRLALGQDLQCEQVGTTYNRIAAFCRLPSGVDLSCAMVASGTTARWERYWKDGPTCP